MFCLIVYDIGVDKVRTKVAARLEAIGLTRIQMSVFLGKVNATSLQKFMDETEEKLSDQDRLYVIPMTTEQAKNMQILGTAPDLELILGERRVMFF